MSIAEILKSNLDLRKWEETNTRDKRWDIWHRQGKNLKGNGCHDNQNMSKMLCWQKIDNV